MGAKCCGTQSKDIELLRVKEQDLLMDNDEVKIIRVRERTMVAPKKGQPNNEIFDGFLQRKSFFVIPQMDQLKREKIELKQQMGVSSVRQKYPKLRVKAAGEDLTKKSALYYVTVV